MSTFTQPKIKMGRYVVRYHNLQYDFGCHTCSEDAGLAFILEMNLQLLHDKGRLLLPLRPPETITPIRGFATINSSCRRYPYSYESDKDNSDLCLTPIYEQFYAGDKIDILVRPDSYIGFIGDENSVLQLTDFGTVT